MYHTISGRLEQEKRKSARISDDDEEIDVISNDENSRLSQGTTASACSSSQGISTEEDYSSNSNSAMDLSISSQASCSSFARPSLLSGTSLTKLNRKRNKVGILTDDTESEDGEGASRKEKSLGLLCKKFLAAMGEEAQSGKDVHLESVAKKMMVEKRRIYDIVNVMEALEAMSKTNKSYYRWHGLNELPHLMALLQHQAKEENLLNRIRRVEQAMCSFTELSSTNKRPNGDIVGTLVGSKTVGANNSSENPLNAGQSGISDFGRSAVVTRAGTARDRNNKNSLAQLCRRFLMVLLCNPKDMRRVSLDVASTVLIKDPESEGFEPPSRSRCRRLYDIANVLVAMGIIKKVHYLFGTKKIPLFVYSGPEPEGRLESAFGKRRSLESRGNLSNTTNTVQKHEEQAEVPKKRISYVDLRRSYSGSQDNKTFSRQKSDLDMLVIASEQRKHGCVKTEDNVANSQRVRFNDENIAPIESVKPVKVIRTSSGAVILKPEPKKFMKHANFELLAPKVLTSPSGQDRKFMKPTCQNFQLFDPEQPHAFQKIEQFPSEIRSGNMSSSHILSGFNNRQTSYQSFAVPSNYSAVNGFASAYSVNALLAGPVVSSASCSVPLYSVLQTRTGKITSKQRGVLGDISQTPRQNN